MASVTSVLSNAILGKARYCPSTDVCCCIPIFSFTLSPTFSLGVFVWIISAVVWSRHLDMFGEPGGPERASPCVCVWMRSRAFIWRYFPDRCPWRLRKRNHLKLFRGCVDGSLGQLCAQLCLDHY